MCVRHTVRRRGFLAGAALAALLGIVSIGASCGADSEGAPASLTVARQDAATGSGGGEDASASDAMDVAADAAPSADAGTASPTFAPDAATDAPDGAAAENTATSGCILQYEVCTADGGIGCCNGGSAGCVHGACGGKLVEGEPCQYEGMTPGNDVAACLNGLACNEGYCGTNACVPDGTACGADAGVVCCNDNCNGSVCRN